MGVPTSDRIVKTPGTCRGKARIAGHRIRVLDIVAWHEHQGMSADEKRRRTYRRWAQKIEH